MNKDWMYLVFYPILLSMHPIIFFYSRNVQLVTIPVLVIFLFLASAIAIVSLVLLRLALKSTHKAGIVLSVAIMVFYSYGHLYTFLEPLFFRAGLNVMNRPNFMLLPFLAVVFWAVSKVCRKFTQERLMSTTRRLNIISAVLVLLSLAGAASAVLKVSDMTTPIETVREAVPEADAGLPNIYYIILDSYAGKETMLKEFGLDNTKFLGFLREKGFYVAENSRSNYNYTTVSTAATFSLDYIHDGSKGNRVCRFLRKRGYTIVYADGSAEKLFREFFRGADMVVTGGNDRRIQEYRFIDGLIDNTLYAHMFNWLGKIMGSPLSDPRKILMYDAMRKKWSTALDYLGEPQETDGPIFVYAHIFASHPPFIFGENGDKPYLPGAVKPVKERYVDQTLYMNSRMRSIIETILSDKRRESIIILQADHGSHLGTREFSIKAALKGFPEPDEMTEEDLDGLKQLFSILNAYYFPDGDYSEVYEGISPVNSFRLIFNKYFGANFDMLEDRNYFSGYLSHDYEEVTEIIN